MVWKWISHTLSTTSSFSKVTNPKPLCLLVCWSISITASSTFPNCQINGFTHLALISSFWFYTGRIFSFPFYSLIQYCGVYLFPYQFGQKIKSDQVIIVKQSQVLKCLGTFFQDMLKYSDHLSPSSTILPRIWIPASVLLERSQIVIKTLQETTNIDNSTNSLVFFPHWI